MKEFFAEVKKSGSDEDKAQAAKAEAELAKAAPRLRTILMARCVSDKWSADLLKCVREVQAKNASTCEAMFMPEQKQRIQNDLVAAGLAPKPAAAAAGGSCDDVVAHIEALMMADAKTPEEKESMAPMVEPLTRIMREQCAASAWSAELRGCLGAAPELPAMEKCDPLFTPAQKAALDHAIGGDANKKQPE